MTDKLSHINYNLKKKEFIGTEKCIFNNIGSNFGFCKKELRVPVKVRFQDFRSFPILFNTIPVLAECTLNFADLFFVEFMRHFRPS